MTTCADLVNDTRRLLFSGKRETLNKLNGEISSTTVTALTLANDPGPIQAGAYLSIDLEIMYVWSVSTRTVTVERGMLGTTADTHVDGSIIYVNSQFPAFSIFSAINDDLNDLSSPENGLYKVTSVEVTYNPAVQGYDITDSDTILNILAVRANIPGPSNDWVPLTAWRYNSQANTTDFPSGNSLTLFQAGSPGLAVRVTYSSPFTTFSSLTDNVTTTGLPATAYDLPPLGAGMRLVGVREVKRNFDESQGDTRRASEVPPNAQMAGYQALARERQRRLKAEAAQLANTWPYRRKGIA